MIRTRIAFASAVLGALCCALAPAQASMTPPQYWDVGVSSPPGAAVPPDAQVTGEDGRRRSLRDLVAGPTVLIFADYTCATLCGPIVSFAAAALAQTGLTPGRDYRLLVIGLDPKDTAADAATMRRAHLGGDAAINGASLFVTADQASVTAITQALGYNYHYDKEHDQFAHPAAAYVLSADGRVARVLTGVGLSGADMRLALVDAGQGKVGTLRDHVRLLCYGFDPAHGTYNVLVSRLLAAAGLTTIIVLGGGIALLALAGRRRPA
ncbi:MAG: SCO family protein [Pseudolabrys sp.]